ncbi:hypothetical protein B0J17DRAFT_286915 [Rhizoctonia solani]|nr:hypothetical protein B0J17DRAFT_286915 [Rhizoctonia solani]
MQWQGSSKTEMNVVLRSTTLFLAWVLWHIGNYGHPAWPDRTHAHRSGRGGTHMPMVSTDLRFRLSLAAGCSHRSSLAGGSSQLATPTTAGMAYRSPPPIPSQFQKYRSVGDMKAGRARAGFEGTHLRIHLERKRPNTHARAWTMADSRNRATSPCSGRSRAWIPSQNEISHNIHCTRQRRFFVHPSSI